MEGAKAGPETDPKEVWNRQVRGTGKGVVTWNDRSRPKPGAFEEKELFLE